jgi:hypothetical protein
MARLPTATVAAARVAIAILLNVLTSGLLFAPCDAILPGVMATASHA